ncbi:MAG TPA: ABC-2 transporter permease [Candidatus Lokiarchaeia archaeon]|nr:ABC-2 transporter permease [Candidatus Lokiarchaeia archaeon]
MSEVRDKLAKDIAKSKFSIKRSITVSKRVLRQITRDKRTFIMLIAMPIVIMAIFGVALSGDVKNLPILIDNEDKGYTGTVGHGQSAVNISFSIGTNITTALQGDDRLQVTLGNFDANKGGVDNGTYYAVMLIPANFSEVLFNKISSAPGSGLANATITIYLDGTKTIVKATVLAALQDNLQAAMGNYSGGIAIDDQYAFGGVEFSGVSQVIPAVMGFVLTMLVLIVSVLMLKRETVEGTEERLLATPLKVSERIIGYVFALVLLNLIMVLAILIIGVYVFGVAVERALWLLILMFLLYAITNVFLSILLSNFARNEIQASQMAVLIALPSLALCGILIPVVSFPGWVQIIAHFIPLYYAVSIFEGVMLKGWGFTILWPDILILCAFAFGFFVLSLVTVKDKLDA